jgi:hypothetical protein
MSDIPEDTYGIEIDRMLARDVIDYLPDGDQLPSKVKDFFTELVNALDDAQSDADEEGALAAVLITVKGASLLR